MDFSPNAPKRKSRCVSLRRNAPYKLLQISTTILFEEVYEICHTQN
jgi:hypothetical protein